MNSSAKSAHWPFLRSSLGVELALVAALSLVAVTSSAEEIVWPNAAADVAGDSATCIPLTGCDGIARYQQVFDSDQFPGIGLVNIVGMRLRPDEGKWPFESHQITSAEINLGTTLNGPKGLTNVFADNFNGAGPIKVYDPLVSGPLTLTSDVVGPVGGPKAFDIEILFDSPFAFDPETGDLLVELKNLSADIAQGRRQLLDAQTFPGDASCRVRIWHEPARRSAMDPEAPTATNGDCAGLIVEFIYQRPDPTQGLNLLAPLGIDVTVIHLENLFEKVAASVLAEGFTDIDICILKDTREIFSSTGERLQYFQQYMPVRNMEIMAGSCAFVASSDLRFPPHARGHAAEFRRRNEQGEVSVQFGVFTVVVHTQSDDDLVFDGPLSVDGIHEFFADNMDLLGFTLNYINPDPSTYTQWPTCNTDLSNRWLMLGGHPDGPNTDMRSVTARCNRLAGIIDRTDLAFPMRQDATMFDENTAVQDQINEINGVLQAAAQCVDAAAANGIALMQGALSDAHNAFAQDRYTDARLAAEQVARYALFSTNDFSGCESVLNYKGRIVALSVTLAFMFWDRWEHPLEGATWAIYNPPADLEVPGL